MLKFNNKKDCCGCEACVNICPKRCIKMLADEEGFLYPQIDQTNCIDCHLCEKTCPMIVADDSEDKHTVKCYAAINTNHEILHQSSSGGVFFNLAKYIIEKKQGYVVGAVIDDYGIIRHQIANTLSRCKHFLGSKYVQSSIDSIYRSILDLLKEGNWVLFSGTPCQIAGIRKFLKKRYETLLTVDFACHGVPSPSVWKDYRNHLCDRHKTETISHISFRNKKYGWKEYSLSYRWEKQGENCIKHSMDSYLQAFKQGLILRPSCYECPFKYNKGRFSDITLCDYWRVRSDEPLFYNKYGVSGVILNTDTGNKVWNDICTDFNVKGISIDALFNSNSSLLKQTPYNIKREQFFKEYCQKEDLCKLLEKYISQNPIDSYRSQLKAALGYMLYRLKILVYNLSKTK